MEDKSNDLIVSKEAEKIIAEGFKAAGITSETPFHVLAEGMKAEKVTTNKFGIETREEDHPTRHKYLVTALELMRILKPNNTIDIKNNVTINSIKLLLPPEYSDRLKGIEGIEI